MNGLPLTLALAGFVLGFRHAFEPDHIAAVSTLATRQGTLRQAAGLGFAWGFGHTASVGAVALLLILAGFRLPAALQPAADLLVAFLLITLGIRSLWVRRHAHVHQGRSARQSFAFGIAHGLAGSGAVMVLMVAAAATAAAQLGYLAAFGAGTVAGMIAVSASVVLAIRTFGRSATWMKMLQMGAATTSVCVGVLLGMECLARL